MRLLLAWVLIMAVTAGAVLADERESVKQDLIGPEAAAAPRGGPVTCTGTAQSLLYGLDGSYSLVDFFGDGATGAGPATGSDQHNDDDSATANMPFAFNFYGTPYTRGYINNNGNISFGSYFSTFTASGFPIDNYPMIAAFWADIDTGSSTNFIGDTWVKYLDSNFNGSLDTMVVTWDRVGYYNEHTDRRNTFQIVLSDGSNPRMGANNNVCFSYNNMCWTTGDASGGTDGFSGTPATAGANQGNGINYFQVGRFDHAGTDFDGPAGNSDGVDYLDNQTFCFNTRTSSTNIPPIPIDFPSGNQVTIDAAAGQTLNLTVGFLSPENDQTTNVAVSDVNGAQGRGLSITNTPGNVARIALRWTPACNATGSYALNFTATDSFNPPGVTSDSLLINVICACAAPTITQHPVGRTVCTGESVTFTCAASGSGPFTYQWQRNSSNISGATAASFSINPVTSGDAGNYTCRVANSCGSAVSNAAVLAVTATPIITTHPASQAVCTGASVTFIATANGVGPLSYQWQKDTTNIPGATSNFLTINPVTAGDAGSYRVSVSNSCGSVLSNSATLTVSSRPTITLQPQGQTVCTGGSIAFVVSAVGTAPLTYQWTKDGSNIAGANSTVYIVNPVTAGSAGTYRVVVSNTCGPTTSDPAVLTVGQGAVITQHPASQSVCPGATVVFSVTATGSNLTFQWQKNAANLSGETAGTLTLNNVSAASAGSYRVVVTGACGSVTSNAATLTISTAPVITLQPQSQSVCDGASVTFTVAANGTAPLTFQWQKNGADISGATGGSLTFNPVRPTDAGTYHVTVRNACGQVTSVDVTLTVGTGPAILTQPQNATACPGDAVSFSVTASGTAPLSYQWRHDGSNISGATAATLNINPVLAGDAGTYVVIVSNACGSVTSNSVTLTFGNPPTITQQPVSYTVCAGASVTFTGAATGGAPLTYQWRRNNVDLAGRTSPSMTINPVGPGDAGTYELVVSNPCGQVTSQQAILTVEVGPSISMQPASQTVCPGDAVTFSVVATGTAPIGYQWRKAGSDVPGATGAFLTIDPVYAGDAGQYRVVVTNACGTVTSNPATLTVELPPSITQQPASQTVCPGDIAMFFVGLNGTQPLDYQWTFNGFPIPGATADSLAIGPVNAAAEGDYQVTVSNACGQVTSQVATLTMNDGPMIVVQPADQSACPGGFVTFEVTVQGSAPLNFQWQKDGSNIPFATASSLTINPVTAGDAGQYRVIVSNPCGSVTSAPATLSFSSGDLLIFEHPSSQTVCAGEPLTLTVSASGTPPPTYQWRKDGVSIPGAAGDTLILPDSTIFDGGTYDVQLSNTCGSLNSDAATIVVWPTGSGDVNGDGLVDGLDIGLFVETIRFARTGPAGLSFCGADMNADGIVNFTDLTMFLAALLAF